MRHFHNIPMALVINIGLHITKHSRVTLFFQLPVHKCQNCDFNNFTHRLTHLRTLPNSAHLLENEQVFESMTRSLNKNMSKSIMDTGPYQGEFLDMCNL